MFSQVPCVQVRLADTSFCISGTLKVMIWLRSRLTFVLPVIFSCKEAEWVLCLIGFYNSAFFGINHKGLHGTEEELLQAWLIGQTSYNIAAHVFGGGRTQQGLCVRHHVLSRIPAGWMSCWRASLYFVARYTEVRKAPFVCICSVSLEGYIKGLRIFRMQHPLQNLEAEQAIEKQCKG